MTDNTPSDETIIDIARRECQLSPWGIGTTRKDFLKAVRAILFHVSSSWEEMERDAARWNEAVRQVGGARNVGAHDMFVFRYLKPLDGADLMRGSVAEHFTRAIDALLAAAEAPKGDAA